MKRGERTRGETSEFDADVPCGVRGASALAVGAKDYRQPAIRPVVPAQDLPAFTSARCALLDHADQVTEQQIGIHVFGRPADYNAGEDNIVRSQARFLRTKLAEYFDSAAGQEEPVVLTIPKGSTCPISRRARGAGRAAPDLRRPPLRLSSSSSAAQPIPGGERGLTACCSRWWSLCSGGALAGTPASRRTRRADHSIWPRLFDCAGQTTTIVASDYIFSMVQEAAGRTLTLDEYLGADYFNRVSRAERRLRAGASVSRTSRNGITRVRKCHRRRAADGLEAGAVHPRLWCGFARDLTMRDVSSGNLILLGSKQSNPWVLLFETKLNFRFEYDSASHSVFIVNRSPQKGEESEYHPSALDATSRLIYGAIAFLPSLNRESNVLILQGTSMGGTEGALELLGNPALSQDLIRHVTGRSPRDGPLPYFEALIRTQTVNGVAGDSSITAFRLIP